MNKKEFREAFKRGLGSAQITLKTCDNLEKYKDIVLYCCLHNTCYDMQVEGDRSWYLYSGIKQFSDKSFFEKEIIRKFNKDRLNFWHLEHLTELLFQFAIDGSQDAREALYNKYDYLFGTLSRMRKHKVVCGNRDSFEYLCVCLTSLDGFTAFKAIVEKVGGYLVKGKSNYGFSMDWFYDNSIGKFGKKRVETYMQKQVEKSIAAKAFYKEIKDNKIKCCPCDPQPAITVDEVIRQAYEIKNDNTNRDIPFIYNSIAFRFAQAASEKDLRELALTAIRETDQQVKLRLLRVFHKVKFPLSDEYIFELAECDNEAIRDTAFCMMGYFESDKMHDYAIALLKEGKEISNSIGLLCKNYTPDDEMLLFDSLKKMRVSYYYGNWHGAFMDVENLFNEFKYKPKTEILSYMYHQNLCSYCRYRIVETMHKCKVLTDSILFECQYDSNEDIRKFARKRSKQVV